MTFLVTGGGGFLGRRLVERLLATDVTVRVFGRHRYSDLAALGVDCIVGDIRDSEAVSGACAGCDGVFHVAGVTGFWGPRERFFTTNVKGTANVIQGCIVQRVPKLVYTSSPSVVYDTHVMNIENGDESLAYPRQFAAPYPESKARAEKMVLDADGWETVVEGPGRGESHILRLATCALRPHLIWGVGDTNLVPRIVRQARAGELRIIGDGRNRVSLTHVDNAADAHIRAMAALPRRPDVAGQAFFVNDPEPVVLWDWVNEILRGAGIPEVRRRMPYRVGWMLGAWMEVLHALVPSFGEPRLTRYVAAQMAGSHWFNCSKAAEAFGYRPSADLEAEMKKLSASIGAVETA